MSDSHVASYKPSEHHAKMAVNSAKIICDFLFESNQAIN
ncbi:MAG: abortive infection family protein [Candidatus Nitrosoglobus sp.]